MFEREKLVKRGRVSTGLGKALLWSLIALVGFPPPSGAAAAAAPTPPFVRKGATTLLAVDPSLTYRITWQVLPGPSGRFVALWQDYTPQRVRVVARAFLKPGVPDGNTTEVTDVAPGDPYHFKAERAASGNILVAWSDGAQTRARWLSPKGVPLAPSKVVGPLRDEIAIGVWPDGGMAMAYRPFHSPGRSLAIRCFDSAGKLYREATVAKLDRAVLPNGAQIIETQSGYWVIWQSLVLGGSSVYRLKARLFDPRCVPLDQAKDLGSFNEQFAVFSDFEASASPSGLILIPAPNYDYPRTGLSAVFLQDPGTWVSEPFEVGKNTDAIWGSTRWVSGETFQLVRQEQRYEQNLVQMQVVSLSEGVPTASLPQRLTTPGKAQGNYKPQITTRSSTQSFLTWIEQEYNHNAGDQAPLHLLTQVLIDRP